MHQQEQQFQQEREFRYYHGYQSSQKDNFTFPEQETPPFEPTMPSGPSLSGTPWSGQFPSAQEGPAQRSALAILCYLGLWLTGFLLLLFGVKDRFVRFHAMQSLLFFGGANVLYIALIAIISNNTPFFYVIPLFYGFAIFAFVLLNIVMVVAWFVGVISAFRGRYAKLPFVGRFAEQFIQHGFIGPMNHPKP